MMHIIIEHMFVKWHGEHIHAGNRISCDHGQSWVIGCKRDKGLVFHKDQVRTFETRHREITLSEYRRRHHFILNFGMVMPCD